MKHPSEIAAKYETIDIHDDTAEGFRFVPAVRRGAKAKVEVTLYRFWENKRRLLTFVNCANVQVNMDADVHFGNIPWNTQGLEASTNADEIRALMRQQKRTWNLSYDKSIDPLPKKLVSADKYVIFKVRFFGGVLVVVARSFTMRRLAKNKIEPSVNG